MQRPITIFLVSLLMMGSVSVSAVDDKGSSVYGGQHDDSTLRNAVSQRGLFDGVKLTELQRQHMRDLMQQARQEMPALPLDDIEKMHDLVIAEKFDEVAVRQQITQMTQVQIERQIEMTRVRNQMYNLLNADQKALLAQQHQQRMSEMRQQLSRTESSMYPPVGAEQ